MGVKDMIQTIKDAAAAKKRKETSQIILDEALEEVRRKLDEDAKKQYAPTGKEK